MNESNPYETTSVSQPIPRDQEDAFQVFSYPRSFLIWMFVCWVSAAPSFFIAMTAAEVRHWVAMVVGVMTFVVGYVYLDASTAGLAFRRRKPVRYAFLATYSLRILISVVFPAAFFVDTFCGLLSSVVVQPFVRQGSQSLSFFAIYLWTIAQGIVLNALLSLIWLVLFGIFASVMKQ